MAVSCGPSRYALHVEMRHPSKSGIDLAGKNVAVVYLENDNVYGNSFSEGIADGLASSIEQDYETGEGSVGVYRMRVVPGGVYSSRDTLVNLILDTDSDVVFLLDTLTVTSSASAASAYASAGNIPFKVKLYCLDAMDRNEKVHAFTGNSVAVPPAETDALQTALPELGFEAGKMIANSFTAQWKHEQFSVLYFDAAPWYKALEYADEYQWKAAMDIWMDLLDTNDLLKRSSAAYNLSLASYMLGDYDLAGLWLDRSDADNKLPQSDILRTRINSKKPK